MPGGPGGRGEMGRGRLQWPEDREGQEKGSKCQAGMMGGYSARFRSLLRKEDEGTAVQVQDMTKYPRVPVNKTLWPYHIDNG